MADKSPLRHAAPDMLSRMVATNPLKVEAARLGVSLTKLAKLSGVSRDTLNDIAQGNSPGTIATFERLQPWLRVPASTMRDRMEAWRGQFPSLHLMTPSARALLNLTPDEVAGRFDSFSEWETHVAGSSRRLALLLHCSPNQLTKYKNGLADSLPQSVVTGLLNDLKLSPEYVGELAALPRVGRVAPQLRAGVNFKDVWGDDNEA